MEALLLAPAEREALRGLSLRPRRRVAGYASGEQRSPSPGPGIEFAEYRAYREGDEARLVDWSVFLRRRELLVKVAAEEKELVLAVLLDASPSMFSGEPAKIGLARRVAAALATVALEGGNRAGLFLVGAGLRELLPPRRSRSLLRDWLAALADFGPEPGFEPGRAMADFASRWAGKCVPVLVSDFLYPGWESGLAALAAAGGSPFALMVLSPEELEPPLLGEATLRDGEGHSGREVSLFADAALLDRYKAELAAHRAKVAEEARRRGLGFHAASSEAELVALLRGPLRAGGLLC